MKEKTVPSEKELMKLDIPSIQRNVRKKRVLKQQTADRTNAQKFIAQ